MPDKFFCYCLATDEVENIADVTVINPEITCSTYPDDGAEPEEGHRTPTKDVDTDDIDQAFANYGRDHPNVATKTLQDQLNIISMVSETVLTIFFETFNITTHQLQYTWYMYVTKNGYCT